MDLQAPNFMSAVLAADTPRTLAESAANRLREAILLGQLPPGSRLSQDALARQLGISRVPLREALQLLAAEGLVEWRAHRAAIVTGLSAEDLAELYRLGAVVEGAAVEQAVRHASPEHIEAIGEVLAAMSRPDITPVEWHACNRNFHAMLAAPAKWPRFQRIIAEVRANTGRYAKAYLQLSGNVRRWEDEHRDIYEAYRNRDRATLAEAVRRHWQHTSDTLQDHLRASAGAQAQYAGEDSV